MKKKKLIDITIDVILCVILLFVFISFLNEAVFAGQIYKNDAFGIIFSYPDEWQIRWTSKDEDKYDPFFLKIEPTKIEEGYIHFDIAVDKYSYARVVEVGSLMKFCQDALFELRKRAISLGPKCECEEINLNGNEGVKMEIFFNSYSQPSENVKGFVIVENERWIWYLFIKNDTLYTLRFIGREDIYNRVKNDVDSVINSFTIKPTPLK